jgi:uncharacterized protein YlaI
MKNVSKYQIEVQCSVCGKLFFIYKSLTKNRPTGMFYCSKECRFDKKATQLRYEHYKKVMLEKYG